MVFLLLSAAILPTRGHIILFIESVVPTNPTQTFVWETHYVNGDIAVSSHYEVTFAMYLLPI